MRRTTTLVAAAALLAVAPTWPAGADTIRPGKWEYTVTTQIPNIQLPPGVTLPPEVKLPPGGGSVTATQTSCVATGDPTAELTKPRGPRAAESKCTVDKMDRRGSTISWSTTCTGPDGTTRSEGSAQYNADRIEATAVTRTSGPNMQPIDITNRISGRHVGPCDGK